jgi:glycosyltransferase involved in cell wall biosynthesis
MTVGIAAISLSGGGAERQAALWARAAADRGAAVRVLALEDGGQGYSLPQQVAVEVLGKRTRRDAARAIVKLRALARECDVVAAFQPYVGMLLMLAGARNHLIVTGQDPRFWSDTTRVPAAGFRAAFRWAAAATAPSDGLVRCHRELGVRPRGDRWLHVPNVVAPEAFGARPAERAGVLFVGRLVPEKEPLLALTAATTAGLGITFLGDGPLRPMLERAARERGVEHLVRLHPFTPAPWDLYARARVLVLSSRYETFANVIVESLAAGTPVVSVDCDFGPREILAGARHSRLTARDAPAIAAALSEVASAPGGADREAECRAIAHRYDLDALAPTIAAALRSVPGRSARHG